MTGYEILSLIVTVLGVASFSAVITMLYARYRDSFVAEVSAGKRDMELIENYFYENQDKVRRRKAFFQGLRSVAYVGLLAIVIIFFILAMFDRFGITLIGNKSIMVVASGSMSEKNEANTYLFNHNLNNQFDTYSIIVLERLDDPEKSLKQYDVIAYVDDKGQNIIHRIKRIEKIDGVTRYVVRGDANDRDDEFKPLPENVLGRYTGRNLPVIGAFILFLQSYSGMTTIAALIYCLIMLDRNSNKIQEAQDARTDFLFEHLNLKDQDALNNLSVDYVEKIYLNKISYSINENGLISREVAQEVLEEYEDEVNKIKAEREKGEGPLQEDPRKDTPTPQTVDEKSQSDSLDKED